MMPASITAKEMQGMINHAQTVERAQIYTIGRRLYAAERGWVVRAAFRFLYGTHIGCDEANRRADLTMRVIDEVAG